MSPSCLLQVRFHTSDNTIPNMRCSPFSVRHRKTVDLNYYESETSFANIVCDIDNRLLVTQIRHFLGTKKTKQSFRTRSVSG